MIYELIKKDSRTSARRGILKLKHGTVQTPVFMPVATRAAIRALPFQFIEDIGFEIVLSNTYHLYLRPGLDVLSEAGGLHKFMNCKLPILTDSGGFQVFSLSNLCKIFAHGIEFSSHIDGSKHFFTPEKVLDIQKVIGSDIMMILDQCCAYPVEKSIASDAVNRTIQWAKQSIDYYKQNFTDDQSIFAIVQGGVFPDLRIKCAEELIQYDFSGFAIGGLSVGEPKDLYREITALTTKILPENKPRYMMGVGSPLEILDGIASGIDMFDCVMPTRIARNGTLYTTKGKINIKNNQYEKDFTPLDSDCQCFVCRNYTKAYLRHIFKMNEIAALIYNTHHNLFFMHSFLSEIRSSIDNGTFSELCDKYRKVY